MSKKSIFKSSQEQESSSKIRVWPVVFVVGFYAESDLIKEEHVAVLEDFLMASDVSLLSIDFEAWPKDLSIQIFEALQLGISGHSEGIGQVAEFLKDYFEKLKGDSFWPERWSDSLKTLLVPPKEFKRGSPELEYVYARGVAVRDIKTKLHIEQIIKFAWTTGVPCFVFRLYENKKELSRLPIPHYSVPAFSITDIDTQDMESASLKIQKILFEGMAGLKEYIKEVDHEQYNN